MNGYRKKSLHANHQESVLASEGLRHIIRVFITFEYMKNKKKKYPHRLHRSRLRAKTIITNPSKCACIKTSARLINKIIEVVNIPRAACDALCL